VKSTADNEAPFQAFAAMVFNEVSIAMLPDPQLEEGWVLSTQLGVKQIDAESAENLPVGQIVHADAEEEEYFPAAQSTHPKVERSAAFEYLPAAQAPHVAALTRLTAKGSDPVPLGQAMHDPPKYIPILHATNLMHIFTL